MEHNGNNQVIEDCNKDTERWVEHNGNNQVIEDCNKDRRLRRDGWSTMEIKRWVEHNGNKCWHFPLYSLYFNVILNTKLMYVQVTFLY